ncbi:hypothetical protein AB0H28_29730 [Micromonospora sp. NPDC050980]|uniref:hypothetical protein n=1 Tax=Micromonospora sp. NPDC050980 TaxID=3155161 RepID=UPI0033D25959
MAIAACGAVALTNAVPALAAPGDARARGVAVDLAATVAGVPVVTANAVIGTATAPDGGTDTDTGIAITIPGALGVTASGTVVQVSATRGDTASSANAQIADVALAVLDAPVLDADVISAAVSCPRQGAQTADTTFTGLTLFGDPIDLAPNTPGVTASGAVTVPGLTGAALNATVQNVETTTDDGAVAIAVQATLRLTGTLVTGTLIDIPVGTVTLAEARCERPLAPSPTPTQPTPSPTQPTPGPTEPTPGPTQPTAAPTQTMAPEQPPTSTPALPVTGGSASALWWLFGTGAAMVTVGATARLIARRTRESSLDV